MSGYHNSILVTIKYELYPLIGGMKMFNHHNLVTKILLFCNLEHNV